MPTSRQQPRREPNRFRIPRVVSLLALTIAVTACTDTDRVTKRDLARLGEEIRTLRQQQDPTGLRDAFQPVAQQLAQFGQHAEQRETDWRDVMAEFRAVVQAVASEDPAVAAPPDLAQRVARLEQRVDQGLAELRSDRDLVLRALESTVMRLDEFLRAVAPFGSPAISSLNPSETDPARPNPSEANPSVPTGSESGTLTAKPTAANGAAANPTAATGAATLDPVAAPVGEPATATPRQPPRSILWWISAAAFLGLAVFAFWLRSRESAPQTEPTLPIEPGVERGELALLLEAESSNEPHESGAPGALVEVLEVDEGGAETPAVAIRELTVEPLEGSTAPGSGSGGRAIVAVAAEAADGDVPAAAGTVAGADLADLLTALGEVEADDPGDSCQPSALAPDEQTTPSRQTRLGCPEVGEVFEMNFEDRGPPPRRPPASGGSSIGSARSYDFDLDPPSEGALDAPDSPAPPAEPAASKPSASDPLQARETPSAPAAPDGESTVDPWTGRGPHWVAHAFLTPHANDIANDLDVRLREDPRILQEPAPSAKVTEDAVAVRLALAPAVGPAGWQRLRSELDAFVRQSTGP